MSETESFFQHQKVLNKIYKPNRAAYLMLIADKHKYWSTHTENFYRLTNKRFTGHFYLSRTIIEKELNISRSTQIRIENELEKDGILTVTKMKHKANWFKVDLKMIQEKIDKYNEEQELAIPFLIDYPFDDTEEYEEWVPNTSERQGDLVDNEAGTPVKKTQSPLSKRPVNNNKEVIIKNKNKVSKGTYVSNVKSKNSCINNKELAKQPPGADAHTGRKAEIYEIIDKYNSVMGLVTVKGDYEAVSNNLDSFKKLERYFTPLGLKYAWKNFPDEGAKEKLKKPQIASIVSWKLLDTFLKRSSEIYAYEADYLDNKLDRAFRYYQNFLNEINPDLFTVDCVGRLSFGGSIGNNKDHREKRLEVYKQYLEPKLLQSEDIHDMMILEV